MSSGLASLIVPAACADALKAALAQANIPCAETGKLNGGRYVVRVQAIYAEQGRQVAEQFTAQSS